MNWTRYLYVLAAAVCVGHGSDSIAQTTGGGTKEAVISLKFAGGTAQQYIEAIQSQAGAVNVLIDKEGKNVPMPAVELTSVNVPSAIQLLEDREADVDMHHVMLDVQTVRPEDQFGQPIYYVRAKSVNARSQTMSTVISVKDIIDGGCSADDLLSAVSTTVELLAGKSGQAQIRFHEPTALLIAKGDKEQISAIHEVIDQIRDSNRRKDNSQEAMQEAKKYYQQMVEMKDQLAARQDEVNKVIQQMTEARTRAEMYQRDLDNAKRMVDERENEMVKMKMRLNELEQELAKAREQLEKAQYN